MKTKKLKWLVKKSNAGEVIDKSYWGDGKEILYTCSRNKIQSDYKNFPVWKRTREDDLLLTRNGTPYIHVPKTGSIYSNVVQRISVTGINRKYLAYALEDRVRTFRGYGVSIESFNYEMWSNLDVYIPDNKSQKLIADFLDHETSKVEGLISKYQFLSNLLEEKLTSFITKITRGGYINETHYSTGIDWWDSAPKSWNKFRVANLFEQVKDTGEDGLPVLSVSINWGISDKELGDDDRHRVVSLIEDKEEYKKVKPGDLVYNMMRAWQGGFGVAKVDGLVSPAYVVARPHDHLHPMYFEYLFRTPPCIEQFKRESKGIADFRQRLYWEYFRQIILIVPPFEQQVEISLLIEKEKSKIKPILSKIKSYIHFLKEYRSVLISSCVTGKFESSKNLLFNSKRTKFDHKSMN